MTTNKLEDDYKYFVENKDDLCRQYPNQFIVIKNKEILGAFDDKVTAYLEASKEHEAGTFIVQECNPDTDIPVQMFHTRAVF